MRARARLALPLLVGALSVGIAPALVAPPVAHAAPAPGDDAPTLLTAKGEVEDGSEEASTAKLRDAYYETRLLSGDNPVSIEQAAQLRTKASRDATSIENDDKKGQTRGGTWQSVGPAPIVQNGRTTNKFQAVTGRIGAMVIRNDGTVVIGAAQGGVWTYDPASGGTWTSRTPDVDTQAIGSMALAPSNDKVIWHRRGRPLG